MQTSDLSLNPYFIAINPDSKAHFEIAYKLGKNDN